ncbi:hypothetical protein FRC15_000945 [Serendipita sp. 397]|nr:hypothetical protein FRC15_000945 [Serendipita sp. 397]
MGKIPTLVAYQYGEVQACGEEAVEAFEDDKSTVAHYFKLHLHPDHMKRSLSRPIPPLPPNVTLEQAYTDIMSYMFRHTREFFESRPGYINTNTWSRLQNSMEIILATPNGWDIREQGFLRRVAIRAGLINSSSAETRLTFITEAEASIHFALHHGSIRNWLREDAMFAVVDAGGSTVDSTLYVCKSAQTPIRLEEVASSKCVQAGGIFVDEQAEVILKQKFRNSRFGTSDYISAMVRVFELKAWNPVIGSSFTYYSQTKRLFAAGRNSNVIDFGGPGDTDNAVGVRRGKVSLTAAEVASCFAVPIRDIRDSVRSLIDARNIQYLVLVGGFGESSYLKQELESAFGARGVSIVVAEEPSRKAAAEGASIWRLTHNVKARAARYTYGTNFADVYNQKYCERSDLKITNPDGRIVMPGAFSTWVKKDVVLADDFAHAVPYAWAWSSNSSSILSDLRGYSTKVYMWDSAAPPTWALDRQGNPMPGIRHLCTITADLSGLYSSLTLCNGPSGQYYQVHFSVLISLGGTQLSARVQWDDKARLFETMKGEMSYD